MNISSVSTASQAPAAGKQQEQLKKVCQDFEATFLNSLLKSMRKTVVENDLFGSSQQEGMFRDMMDSEVCNSAAKTSSMGIADMMYRQMSAGPKSGIGHRADKTEGGSR